MLRLDVDLRIECVLLLLCAAAVAVVASVRHCASVFHPVVREELAVTLVDAEGLLKSGRRQLDRGHPNGY